jgi:hypothetical protein
VTPEEHRARGYRLSALLDDPDIQDAFRDIEDELSESWKSCFDADERHNLWLSIRLLDKLQTWMRSGASYDLTALRRMK